MNELRDEFLSRELHEECGIFGIYNNSDAASLSYYGLHALQHRGQVGSGNRSLRHRWRNQLL